MLKVVMPRTSAGLAARKHARPRREAIMPHPPSPQLGLTISTTRPIPGAIVLVGADRRAADLRWGVAKSVTPAVAMFYDLGFWMT